MISNKSIITKFGTFFLERKLTRGPKRRAKKMARNKGIKILLNSFKKNMVITAANSIYKPRRYRPALL
jgi:hypothetical protein